MSKIEHPVPPRAPHGGPATAGGPEIKPRQLQQVGFVQVRCPTCNALACSVTPGAVVSTVCRRCDRQILHCVPHTHFVVDASSFSGQAGTREG